MKNIKYLKGLRGTKKMIFRITIVVISIFIVRGNISGYTVKGSVHFSVKRNFSLVHIKAGLNPETKLGIGVTNFTLTDLSGSVDVIFSSPGFSSVTNTYSSDATNESITLTKLVSKPTIIEDFSETGNWTATPEVGTASVSIDTTLVPYTNSVLEDSYGFLAKSSSCLALNYQLVGAPMGNAGSRRLTYTGDIEITSLPSGIGFYFYGDNNSFYLQAYISDNNGTQKIVGSGKDIEWDDGTIKIDWSGWKYLSFSIPDTMTPPITFNYFYMYGSSTVDSSVYVDEMMAFDLPPSAPQNFKIDVSEDGQIGLSWGTTSGAVFYNIYRSTSPNIDITDISNLLAVEVAGNSYIDTDIMGRKTYYYKVTAVDGYANESVGSDEKQAVAISTAQIKDLIIKNNYFNPDRNEQANITFTLEKPLKVTVKIYSVMKKLKRILVNDEEYTSGNHTVVWDGKDKDGKVLDSGLYFIYVGDGMTGEVQRAIIIRTK